MTYAEKLKLPKWQKKRLEIMQRDGWKCLDCGNSTVTLNVHHKEYKFGREPWEYEDENFETLCEPCHIDRHAEPSEPKAISELLEVTPGGYIDLQRKAYRETLKVRKDLSSQQMLPRALSCYIMNLTLKQEENLVALYCLTPVKFIRENYFVVLSKNIEEHRQFEADKSNLIDHMNDFFTGNICLSIVLAENNSL